MPSWAQDEGDVASDSSSAEEEIITARRNTRCQVGEDARDAVVCNRNCVVMTTHMERHARLASLPEMAAVSHGQPWR